MSLDKKKAQKRWERNLRIKRRWRDVWKHYHGYNERSWEYAFYGDKIFEWLEAQMRWWNTRSLCSRPCCGNPRRHYRDYDQHYTMQEKKNFDRVKDQLEDWYGYHEG